MRADSLVQQLLGTEPFDFVKVMGKPVALHPVVETEIRLETRIDHICHIERPVGQTLAGMVDNRKWIGLRRDAAADGR